MRVIVRSGFRTMGRYLATMSADGCDELVVLVLCFDMEVV